MTTNDDMPPRQPGDSGTPEHPIHDDLDAVDETVAKITDAEVEEQLHRVLGQLGHARPIPEPVWQDFHAGQTAAKIVGAARRKARLQIWAAQESVAAARQEAERIVADARAEADTALEQAATMIRDAREKAARQAEDILAAARADADHALNRARQQAEDILTAAREREHRHFNECTTNFEPSSDAISHIFAGSLAVQSHVHIFALHHGLLDPANIAARAEVVNSLYSYSPRSIADPLREVADLDVWATFRDPIASWYGRPPKTGRRELTFGAGEDDGPPRPWSAAPMTPPDPTRRPGARPLPWRLDFSGLADVSGRQPSVPARGLGRSALPAAARPRRVANEAHLLADLKNVLQPRRRATILSLAWWWRWEAIATLSVVLGMLLANALGGHWAVIGLLAALGACALWPPARRALTAQAWRIITPHRFRVGCVQAHIRSGNGRLPTILRTTRKPFGERLLVWCPAGTSAADFRSARYILAAVCWATDIQVTNDKQHAQLVTIDVIRRGGQMAADQRTREKRPKRLPEFGELESAIMDVVWAGDRAYLVREVRERLSYNRPVAYTTVMTVMNILYGKGVLCREKHGRAWRYWPVESREEHDARLMSEVLRSGGDQRITMLRFVERVNEEERDSLRSDLLHPPSEAIDAG